MHSRSKRLLFRLMGIAFLICAVESITASQSLESANSAKDLVLGTWTLNVAKSTYRPGPPPKSQVRTYEPHADGIHAVIKTVEADGRSTTIEYTAKYDGVDYPITGNPDWDVITLKRVNAYAAEAALSHGGSEIGHARRVISQDGKTMTITFHAQVEGRPVVDNVYVFDKQEK